LAAFFFLAGFFFATFFAAFFLAGMFFLSFPFFWLMTLFLTTPSGYILILGGERLNFRSTVSNTPNLPTRKNIISKKFFFGNRYFKKK
jgi:hypothetical protein